MVEHDQVETVDLEFEQFARRKRDQRQLAHRRSVLFLGRSQHREVHQVDRRIGLEQRSPGPLAGVRRTRDQQHAQPVPDRVDRMGNPVVDRAEFVGPLRDLDFHDGLAGTREFERQLLVPLDRYVHGPERFAVNQNRYRNDGVRRDPGVLHPEPDADQVAHHPEGRRLFDHDPPVVLAAPAGQHQMERRRQRRPVRPGIRVVNLSVRDRDDRRQPMVGDIAALAGDHIEQACSAPACSLHPHDPDLEVGPALHGRLEVRKHPVPDRGPVAHTLAGAVVHDEHRDIGSRFACLANQGRIGKREQEHRHGKCAPPDAGGTDPQTPADQQHGHKSNGAEGPRVQQRINVKADGVSHHWPSRSRMVGTWTWSDL